MIELLVMKAQTEEGTGAWSGSFIVYSIRATELLN